MHLAQAILKNLNKDLKKKSDGMILVHVAVIRSIKNVAG